MMEVMSSETPTGTRRPSDPCADGEPDESRLRAWEQRTEWPLIALSVLFFAVYAWTVLQPDMAPDLRRGLGFGMWLTWVVFAVDYLVRLALARRRGRFCSNCECCGWSWC